MPLISVLVPTHNRQRYAISTVKALMTSLRESEIVVCDTSDEDLLSEALADGIASGRVKLARPRADRPLSVVDNFRAALKEATGDYVIFIGDDDFVHESAEAIARWASASRIDVLRCTFPASYYWPDFMSRYFGASYAAKLAINDYTGAATTLNPSAAYQAALKNLGGGVMQMPRAYLGMVSQRLIRTVEERHGSLFGGVSPDIYSAALISSAASTCVELDFPFIVPGSSGASTSGQSAKGTHKGELRDNAHISPFVDLVWDPRIPEFYSVPTVWSYSLIKAAEKLGDDHKANFARLYVKCLMGHPDYLSETLAAMHHYASTRGWWTMASSVVVQLIVEVGAQLKRVGRRLLTPKATGKAHQILALSDCLEASIALSRYIEDRGQDAAPLAWRLPSGGQAGN